MGSARPAQAVDEKLDAAGAAPVVNVNINAVVHIHPWGSDEGKVAVTPGMLNEVFSNSQRLRDYCRFDCADLMDVGKALAYVTEGLVELARRAHSAPEARNIYLNPRRADQALVFTPRGWEAITLQDGTRRIFDEIGRGIARVVGVDSQMAKLSTDAMQGAPGISVVYAEAPDRVVDEARKPMAAHLSNLAPPARAPAK